MKDLIERQAAIDVLHGYFDGMLETDTWSPCDVYGLIEILPSAQPELPEWAQKVEEYRKSAPSFVRNQLVWALYQTWKEYDGRLVHQRGKENR